MQIGEGNVDKNVLCFGKSVCALLVRRGGSTSDGFLSSTEYSVWASTMKLQEDEAHPTLKESHFVSLTTDQPPQVSSSYY